MIERAWLPGTVEIRQDGRRVAGRLGYRQKGMLSTGSGRGTNERPLGEVIEVGAFRFSARAAKAADRDDDIVALSAHDSTRPLASVRSGTLDVEDSPEGLDFEAALPNTTAANDVLELIRTGIAAGISFGFSLPPQRRSPNALAMKREPFTLGEGDDAVRFDPEPDVPGADVRIIRDLILFEISLGVARPVFKQNTARVREQRLTRVRRPIWLP